MKVSFSRNRVPVGDTATETENVAEEVSKALECFGEARISFIIWPVFAASRVAGLMPLAYKPTPATQLTPSTGSANSAPSTKRQAIRGPDLNVSYPWLSVCILALCVSSYAFSVELGHLHQLIADPKTDLKDYLHVVPTLLNTFQGVVCVIQGMLAAKTLALCLHKALTSLRKISSLAAASVAFAADSSSPPASTPPKIDGCALLSLIFVYYSFLITAQVFHDESRIASVADNAAFIWCRLVPVVVEAQFLLVTLLVEWALRALATAVDSATSGDSPRHTTASMVHPSSPVPSMQPLCHGVASRATLLVELRRLHHKVSGVIELANKYFGPQLLFMIIQTRIQLITDGYKVVTALTPEGSSYFESVFEVCFQWIRLFQIVYLSERVIQQDERILHLLHTVDSSSSDRASLSQLHLLRRQVSALRPHMNTCSFFNLDYNLLLSVIATTSTFLVVLVQFRE